MSFRLLLFLLYLGLLFKLLFLKIRFVFSDIDIGDNHDATFDTLLAASNFIPLAKIYYYANHEEPYLVGLLNVGGNIVLFIPMGFFLPAFFPRINTGTRLAAVTALLSLCIEVLQLLTTTGNFDVDDVILNTLGAWIGYVCYERWFRRTEGLENSV